MRYVRILLAAAGELWAMEPTKLDAVVRFLARQAAGEKLGADEIEARIGKKQEQAVAARQGNVAMLPLRGMIGNRMSMMEDTSGPGGTSSEAFGRAFTAAIRDDGVKAVVIDVDSPGGVVSGSDELSTLIHGARGSKPIVAHVNALGASAAYWIASAADEVVVTPTAEIGSIGVYTVHEDISAALEMEGVKSTLIKAGKHKGEGAPFAPLSDETREYIQARVDEAYGMFVAAVARNRNTTPAAVRGGFGEGRLVGARAAVSGGMADRVATLEETLQRFGASLYAPPPAARRAFAIEREKRALSA